MSRFLNSVISQLGRDTGKVLSNSVFGDAHSTPIRMIRSISKSSGGSAKEIIERKSNKTEFEKALDFDRSTTPKTLIRRTHALSIILEEEMIRLLADEFFSAEESAEAFRMINQFCQKAESIAKQLQIDEEGNASELFQLEKIVVQTNEDFKKLLLKGAESCDLVSSQLQGSAHEKFKFNFFRWLILNTVFMRGYAKSGEKKIGNTIAANLFLFGGQILMFLIGLLTAPSEIARLKKSRSAYLKASQRERERATKYREIIKGKSMS